jgi:hypothetical protein
MQFRLFTRSCLLPVVAVLIIVISRVRYGDAFHMTPTTQCLYNTNSHVSCIVGGNTGMMSFWKGHTPVVGSGYLQLHPHQAPELEQHAKEMFQSMKRDLEQYNYPKLHHRTNTSPPTVTTKTMTGNNGTAPPLLAWCRRVMLRARRNGDGEDNRIEHDILSSSSSSSSSKRIMTMMAMHSSSVSSNNIISKSNLEKLP